MTLTEKTSSAQRSVMTMMMMSMMMTILMMVMTMKMTMTGERAGVVPSLPPRGRSHAL